MKNLPRFLGIIALAAVIGFTACDNGTTSGGSKGPGVQKPVVPLKETYVSYDTDGNKYELVITEVVGRTLGRALDPDKDYTYTLTITFVNGTKATSTGTVVINIDTETDAIVSIDLKHTGTGTTITVTVSSSDDSDTGAITKIVSESETIPVDIGDDPPIPAALPYTPNETGIGGKGYIIINGESFIENGVANNIPETFLGQPVIGIGWAAFTDNKDLISITIPASITHIGWGWNFVNCTNLTTVTFAAGSKLEHIGEGAFKDCTSLTSITIPASVIDISGWGTFANCENLKTVTFESGSRLQTIAGGGTFVDCTSLTSIEIPASVTTITNWGTFERCTNLKTVTFESGSKLKTIAGGGTFADCTSLTSIEIPVSVTDISGWGTFWRCTNLTTVTFAPNSQLKTITGGGTFADCTSISEITIPASVTTIEGWGTFAGWTPSQTINVYHASRAAASAAWGDWLGDCRAVIKYWNGSTFEEPGLEYELTDDGTGYRVVYGPRSGAVNIPATYNGKPVTEIGGRAFEGTGITGITFAPGSQLEYIGYAAFARCTSLTSITIPASVTSIYSAFMGCLSLTNITVDAGSSYYTSENGILYSKDKTELVAYPSASGNITIPSFVTTIGGDAFHGCENLTGITFPASVTHILYHVFIGCTGISSITIPATVEFLAHALFEGWTASQTINIEGHASQAAADAAWANAEWHENWRTGCNARIIYNGN